MLMKTKPLDQSPDSGHHLRQTRRHFFGTAARGIGAAALSSLLSRDALASGGTRTGGLLDGAHHPARAKRIIYLFQSGAPSQQDLFDNKPRLRELQGQDMHEHFEVNQRLTGMTANQAAFPLAGSKFNFSRHGKCGMELSELLPNIAGIADDLCLVRSMHTEAINHDPAITFFQTGHQLAGRPSFGSWLSYGLGSANDDLPSFIVMVSRGTGRPTCQPLYDRLWGSGFAPTRHAGVKFMSVGDPVLYLNNPPGLAPGARRRMLDDLATINRQAHNTFGDPEIDARIQQYEMAYRMQTSVPELTDFSDEPEHILDMYGPDVRTRGTYAYNCLLARRMAERDVRFIQLYHMGWDQHFALPRALPAQCRDTDQPSAALVKDLKQRGLLDDTLVVWTGEFGRTSYCQGKLTPTNYGRDHHPRCFSLWLAGGGIRPGLTYGRTDEFCYDIVENPVEVHDLNATLLHQLGIDHERLTYFYQGRHYRLTDIHGHVVKDILA